MNWNLAGVAASLALGAFAFARSRVPGTFYDAGVYGLTPAAHVRYAAVFLGAAALFAANWVFDWRAATIVAGAATLAALFYLTSFLRGAHEDDD